MSDRAALIISCSRQQAATIHQRAELERRTVSGYVLRILMRWLGLEERLAVIQQEGDRPLTALQPVRPSGKRTTMLDRKSTRLNSSHGYISYAVFCLKKKKQHGLCRHTSQEHRPFWTVSVETPLTVTGQLIVDT